MWKGPAECSTYVLSGQGVQGVQGEAGRGLNGARGDPRPPTLNTWYSCTSLRYKAESPWLPMGKEHHRHQGAP